jgi:hypothetical protein
VKTPAAQKPKRKQLKEISYNKFNGKKAKSI